MQQDVPGRTVDPGILSNSLPLPFRLTNLALFLRFRAFAEKVSNDFMQSGLRQFAQLWNIIFHYQVSMRLNTVDSKLVTIELSYHLCLKAFRRPLLQHHCNTSRLI